MGFRDAGQGDKSLTYYAHSDDSKDREEWHRLSKHLEDTGARADRFLESVGCGDLAKAAGLLHDIGKYSREFQARLDGGPRCDHSTAGAKLAIERYGDGDAGKRSLGKMLAYVIAGHHAGLADGVGGDGPRPLADRLNTPVPRLDPVWEREITLPSLSPPHLKPGHIEMAGFCAAFATRMIFSALVDADYLDTEAWYERSEGLPIARGRHPSLPELSVRLSAYLEGLMSDAPNTQVNSVRREVLTYARDKATEQPGLFSLTVPTGGGKTLSSLAFALEHAVNHGLARVIYVIPYTSIIEQTARVFRQALGGTGDDVSDFIIEHHSAFDEERIREREAKDKLRLAMENWDAPIIVTTAVQFFESLFANRPSRCRKLHNIVRSVVILDEAQTLPLRLLRPCVAALDELARNWQTSVVLCTATQPALKVADGFRGGLEGMREIAPNPTELHRGLKRVRICRQGEKLADADLAGLLRDSKQALCIVNTRRHARELYETIHDENGSFHLSTLMCARHRGEVLETVRRRLDDNAPVRLIATSLIEAGVDVDFPVVWRAEAGLESIVQAAGRCNREGKAAVGNVFVFEPADRDGRRPPGDVGKLAATARGVMRFHSDPSAPEAIRAYFQEVYWIEDSGLDRENILRDLRERQSSFDFPFASIARKFRFIENQMVPIIVPFRGAKGDDESAQHLLRDLEHVERPGAIARRLQRYTIQVPRRDRSQLLEAGAVRFILKERFGEQFAVLENLSLYRPDVGLTWSDPAFLDPAGLIL